MMRLSDIQTCTGGVLLQGDADFSGVAIDTRRCQPGNLFVAVSGEARDGHAYLDDARAAGAAAALVSKPSSVDLPQIKVPDTRRAFGEFAGCWRQRFSLPLIAVTGSNGKTSVKELLAAILGRQGSVLATEGNLNNDLGVPMTLLRLTKEHQYAVIEMGANAAGEIAELAAMATPDVGLVNNAGAAHIEGFGSPEGVARAKGEMFTSLGPHATAVMNIDSDWYPLWRNSSSAGQAVTFGFCEQADVRAENIVSSMSGSCFEIRVADARVDVNLPLPGRHNVANALAATAAAMAVGVSLEDCAAGLAEANSVSGRLNVRRRLDGGDLVDDSYNANPSSFQAAFDWLAAQDRPVWVAMGDMAELGDEAEKIHGEVGAAARAAGVQRLFACGSLSAAAATGFGDGGQHFFDLDQLVSQLQAELPADAVLLVKGSRRARMERVTAALVGENI